MSKKRTDDADPADTTVSGATALMAAVLPTDAGDSAAVKEREVTLEFVSALAAPGPGWSDLAKWIVRALPD